MWGQGVSALLSAYPSTHILGLSATSIRYLDNQRDMADELFEGNVASEMTLGEAIVKGVWLGKSIYTQKKKYEQGLLTENQKELLDKLPMEQVGRRNKS